MADDRAVLVVANSVADAQHIFDALAPTVIERHGEDAAILLHSRFRRGDRADIEKLVTKRYGSRSARQPGLVVATQVVEVSLDVDFDILHTSAGPLEALLQRFGRVNRLGTREPAWVIVHQPAYRIPRVGEHDGEEYADGVYPHAPVRTGWQILAGHDGETIDEVQATGWLDEVYATEWGRRWREEVDRAQKAFTGDFLTFRYPFADRSQLAESFDRLFDGTEAILADDCDAYAQALNSDPGSAGRILGEELLIPMPYWARALPRYDKVLKVRVVEGDYSPRRGLASVHPVAGKPT
jgi:CRISPR-associated endonuclease/helicase Cas3